MYARVEFQQGGGQASGVTSRTYSPSALCQTGDLMVVCHLLSGLNTITPPVAGSWTHIHTYDVGGSRVALYWGIRGVSDTSYTFTCGGAAVTWWVADHTVRMLGSQSWTVSSPTTVAGSVTTTPTLAASPVGVYDTDMVLSYFMYNSGALQVTTSPITNPYAYDVNDPINGGSSLLFRPLVWPNLRKTVGPGNTLQIPAQTWSNNNNVGIASATIVVSDANYSFAAAKNSQGGSKVLRSGYSAIPASLQAEGVNLQRAGVNGAFRDSVEPAYGGSVSVR